MKALSFTSHRETAQKQMAAQLRAIADQMDEGDADFDGVVIVGFQSLTEYCVVYPLNLTPMQLIYCGHEAIKLADVNLLEDEDE